MITHKLLYSIMYHNILFQASLFQPSNISPNPVVSTWTSTEIFATLPAMWKFPLKLSLKIPIKSDNGGSSYDKGCTPSFII